MAESVVQIVWICTGVFSHGSIMWWEKVKSLLLWQGWTWHCTVQVRTENPNFVPLQVFPLGILLSLSSPWTLFLIPLAKARMFLGVLATTVLLLCFTLKISQRGQSHKKEDRSEQESLTLCVTSQVWLLSTISLLLSTFQSSSCFVF